MALLKWQDKRDFLQIVLSCKKLLKSSHCQTSFYFYGIMGEYLSFVTSSCWLRAPYSEWKMLTWIYRLSLWTILVFWLCIWPEQITIISMPTKVQIPKSSSINSLILRPVLRIVLGMDLLMLKMEQLTSWLQSVHHAVSFFPQVVITVSAKQPKNVRQTLEDSVSLLS